MAEHTYKPGESVAIKFEPGVLPDGSVEITGRYGSYIVPCHRLAPWMPAQDQDALLRVVKAAMFMQAERDRYMAHSQMDAAEGYYAALAELRAAMGALSPEILSRVARLSEGE